ncbi:MAG: DinB family protein [Pseudomonadota bacterium]
MITPKYCHEMSRYNAWQNHSLYTAAAGLTEAARQEDRGAFWGSIHATLSHLYWGDTVWIARFDGGPGADVPGSESATAYDWSTLWAGRPKLDARIKAWAGSLTQEDLAGVIHWYSGFAKSNMHLLKAIAVVQLFNHQTHHRGQVHAMLTAAGAKPDDTDLQLMPNEAPEWR